MQTTLWSAACFGLDLTAKVTFLLALVLLLIGGLRRLSASARHLLAMLALAGSIALALVAPLVPPVRIPLVPSILPAPPKPLAWRADRESLPRPAPEKAFEPGASHAASRADDAVGPHPLPRASALAASAASPRRPLWPAAPTPLGWIEIALGVWAAGATVSLARLAFGWARLARIADTADPVEEPAWTLAAADLASRLGLSRPVRLLSSPRVPVAMTAGVRRPILLLNQGARKWPAERRRVVLLHELAHVRRFDWITLIVAELAAALYWFHPLIWVARAQARRSCECACDDLVLDSGTKPSVYAAHLLGIVRGLKPVRGSALPVMAMARPSQFEGRMRAILDPGLHRRGPSRAATRGAALGALFAVVSLGAVQPWVDRTCPSSLHVAGSAARPAALDRRTAGKKPCHGKPSAAPAETRPGSSSSSAEQPSGFVLASSSSARSGSDWYSHAMELHHEERYDAAIDAFQKAIELGYKEAASTYNIACGYARKGEAEKALAWLDRAKDLGFPVASYLAHDDDLDALRSNPKYAALRREARTAKDRDTDDSARQATKAWERLEARGTRDGSAFFQNGRELLSADDPALAAKAFRRSAELGYRPGASFYNEACALSLAGQTAAALGALRGAIENGYDDPGHMRSDDDLDGIRSDRGYRELEVLARDLAMPSVERGFGLLRSVRRAGWRDAAREAERVATKYPSLGRAWFNLGFAQLRAERPEAALESFRKALELGYRKPATTYNIACSYARLDRKDEAFDWLFRSLNAGFDSDGMLRGDEDLDNLRGDPRYRTVLEMARATSASKGD